jgi:hypothetical protein
MRKEHTTIILSTCKYAQHGWQAVYEDHTFLGSYMGYYATCSLHPHPNLAQNSISASDPVIETVKHRLKATIFLNLDTAFSTLWAGHLYKIHKFLHFT